MFDHIIRVEANDTEVPASKYTLYYCTQIITDAQLATAMNSLDSLADYWTTTLPADKTTIYAFMVALDDDIMVPPGKYLVLTFETSVAIMTAVDKTVLPASRADDTWKVQMILHSSDSKATNNIVGYATITDTTEGSTHTRCTRTPG